LSFEHWICGIMVLMEGGLKRSQFFTLFFVIVLISFLTSCSPSIPVENQKTPVKLNKFFIQVIDGDTILYRGVYMRFLGVDTPEIRNPERGIYSDQPFGRKAKSFTLSQIKGAKEVTYVSDGRDKYGRLLVHIFVDGYPLSLKLVEEGLAYETVSIFGDNGFPEIARRILLASKLHEKLPFENPYYWRKKNRVSKL